MPHSSAWATASDAPLISEAVGEGSVKIYGDSISGNCLKVRWIADYLGLAYDWIETDVLKSQTRTPQFLALNPAGQVPTVVLDDGRSLAQSNAIILHLAERSDLVPSDRYNRAKMLEWMFWEQYSHEPYVAVARFQVKYLGRDPAALDEGLVSRARAALDHLEGALSGDFLVDGRLSLADVALVPYTRLAPEGGLSLLQRPRLRAWIGRVERALRIDR
jgi:glutathione S-transferase